MMDSNSIVSTRLDASQSTLTNIATGAQSFLNQLTAAPNSTIQNILQTEATSSLSSLIGSLNTQVNGAYLFAGINADVKPVADYYEAGSPNRQAVVNAFTTAFGFPPTDPQVANISAAAMETFLNGPFANLFTDTAWKADWSSASDQDVRSRISTTELIDTSTNANDVSFRKLASAYTMLADLGTASLSKTAFQKVVDKATALTSEAIRGLTDLQVGLGDAQKRVSDANDRMSLQSDIMTTHIGALEGIDPYEASSRLSELMTQVETAYAITARIQKLSLLNYLAP
jgi:flagellar hook-associated protein 3 FlgL